ncbi:MAG: MazG nucleotide pyrophosphohydrolase domain-containing protein [Faecousia sp.]
MDTIKINLHETEILAQLAEEASELAQAALKLRRAIDKWNPTVVSEESARDHLREEIGDVLNCLGQLTTDYDMAVAESYRRLKLRRWADRLDAAKRTKETKREGT